MQRILKFSKYLPGFGFTPYILTVDDKIASYPILDDSLADDVPAGMPVIRTHSFEPLRILSALSGNRAPHGGFANKDKEKFSQKLLRFIRGNFFIPDARKGWVKYAAAKASEIIERENISTVLISSPPHSSQLVGLKLKERFPKIKWIADLRDPWTDIYYYRDMLHTRRAAAADAAFERKVVEQADALVVVSEPIKEGFLSKAPGVAASKVHVIPNGFDEDDFGNNLFAADDTFTIMYVGTMADSYNPGIFFTALQSVKRRRPDLRFRLRFVGSRTENIVSLVRKNELEEITEFVPHVAHREAIRYMQSSDALLLVIPDVEGSAGILTGKLFEYLACHRPVVCIGPEDGDAAAIIRECDAGKTFNRSQQDDLAEYLLQLSEKKNVRVGNEFVQKYTRKNLTQQLSSLL